MRSTVRGAALVAVALLTMAVGSAPAFGQAAFRLDSLADSSVAPGEDLDFNLQVTNVGNTVADGTGADPIVLKAMLPAGMTGQSVTIYNHQDVAVSPYHWTCTGNGGGSVVGASTITCTIPDSLGPNSYSLGLAGVPVLPTFRVHVAGGATGTLVASFSVTGGGATPASTVDPTVVTDTPPGFGIDAFDGQVSADAAGNPFTQAGGHPYEASTSIDFNTVTNPAPLIGDLWPVEPTKDVSADLPPGFIGNPTGLSRCTAGELANSEGTAAKPLCPITSQVGTVLVRLNSGTPPVTADVLGPLPLFNMDPPPNQPAQFGFNVLGTTVTLGARVRSDGDYGISVDSRNLSEGIPIAGTTLTLWGVPADPSHDPQRACPGQGPPWLGGNSCTSGAPRTAFLRNPTSCTPPGVGLVTGLHLDSWTNPAAWTAAGTPDLSDGNWKASSFTSHLPPAYPSPPSDWGAPQGTTGCDKVPFTPALVGQPAGGARAGAPVGFAFDVTLPQSDDPNAIGEGDLKEAQVTLPAGVRLSPSSATGLQACTPEQIGLHSLFDPACPDAAKVGSLTIETPLLNNPLTGSIYLATPHQNPFGSLVAIYLVAKGSGVTVKLAGNVTLDPVTGQISTTFDDNPQTPFSKLHLEFAGGPHAPLIAPDTCGSNNTTHAVFTSWSGAQVSSDSSFTVSGDGAGGPCPAPQFAPTFSAGAENPIADADTSFVVNLARGDQDQQIDGLSVTLPTGLTGRIARTQLCAEAQAAAGSCPAGSLVGGVTVGAGAGPDPFFITNGRAYITGPYKGAPFGLSIVVPAVAGPFDLGNVVVRAALYVDHHTAQIHVVSDPLPRILQGIPLDVRDIRVRVDKPGFMVTPTSCAEKQVKATITSIANAIAHVSSRFQVAECASLPFKPRMQLSVGAKGRTAAGVTTPFTTVLTQTPGQSNLKSVTVTLPKILNARLGVVSNACTQAQFAAGHCEKARTGSAVAVTPLLAKPLRGSVYFVKHPGQGLPDLVVALRGQVNFDLVGRVSIPGSTQLRTTFATIPDVPIKSFRLSLVAGKQGALGTISNLCSAKARKATVNIRYNAQNGRTQTTNQRFTIHGCPAKRRHG